MAEFTVPAHVRDYLVTSGTTGQWSSSLIGSNIAAASDNLQRWTNRQFEPQGSNTAVAKTFSTLGRTYLVIPDLRTVTSVVLNGATLTADSSYYLTPDRHQTGVYVGIEFPNRSAFLHHSEWFDRNYDSRYWQSRLDRGVPNDLVITGVWGHLPYPAALVHATVVLAGFYTLRPDALLSGAVNRLSEGVIFDLSQFPLEVQGFVADWKLDNAVVVT